jgi:hypothetical protein
MMEIQAIAIRKELFMSKDMHLCPECGGSMTEVERVNENGFAYIWYECSQIDCDGQWLEKKAVSLL